MQILQLTKARALVPLGQNDFLLPPARFDFNEHFGTARQTDEVLPRRSICPRRLPAVNRQPTMALQEVADRYLGDRVIALAGAVAETRQKSLELTLPLDKLEPSLVLVRYLNA